METERELRKKAEKALDEAHSHESALAQAKHQAATQLAVSCLCPSLGFARAPPVAAHSLWCMGMLRWTLPHQSRPLATHTQMANMNAEKERAAAERALKEALAAAEAQRAKDVAAEAARWKEARRLRPWTCLPELEFSWAPQ